MSNPKFDKLLEEFIKTLPENDQKYYYEYLSTCPVPNQQGGTPPQTSAEKFWGPPKKFLRFLRDLRCNNYARVLPDQVYIVEQFKSNILKNAVRPKGVQANAANALAIALQNNPQLNASDLANLRLTNKRIQNVVRQSEPMNEHMRNLVIEAHKNNPEQDSPLANNFIVTMFVHRLMALENFIKKSPIKGKHYLIALETSGSNPKHMLIYFNDTIHRMFVYFPVSSPSSERKYHKIVIIRVVDAISMHNDFRNYVYGNPPGEGYTDASEFPSINPNALNYETWRYEDMLTAITSPCRMKVTVYTSYNIRNLIEYTFKVYFIEDKLPGVFIVPMDHRPFLEYIKDLELKEKQKDQNMIAPAPRNPPPSDEDFRANFGTEFPIMEDNREHPPPLIDHELMLAIMSIKTKTTPSLYVTTNVYISIYNKMLQCPPNERDLYIQNLKWWFSQPLILIPRQTFRLTCEALQRLESLKNRPTPKKAINDLKFVNYHVNCNLPWMIIKLYATDEDMLSRTLVSYVFLRSLQNIWAYIGAFPGEVVILNTKISYNDNNTELTFDTNSRRNSTNQGFMDGRYDYNVDQTMLNDIIWNSYDVQKYEELNKNNMRADTNFVYLKIEPQYVGGMSPDFVMKQYFYNIYVPAHDEFIGLRARIKDNPFIKNSQKGGKISKYKITTI